MSIELPPLKLPALPSLPCRSMADHERYIIELREVMRCRERILMARIAELEADAKQARMMTWARIGAAYLAPQAPPAAVADVTPMRQPRLDLARLVDAISAAVYANGDGLSVTEAIGALELAKLELLKEQEQ